MFETYDKTQNAYVEHVGEYYDKDQGAWVEVPSAMTYDTTEQAWVERLYQGYFTLSNATIRESDEFAFTKNEVTLFATNTAEYRHITFVLPLKWAGETIEFDLTKNAIAKVSVGTKFKYGRYTSSGQQNPVTDVYDGKYTVTLGTCPDEYEGNAVTDSEISVEIYISAENAANDHAYVTISNLKVNGKKYGFTS